MRDGDEQPRHANRRRFLKSVGALSVVGLAGCGGDGDDTPTNTDAGRNGNGNGNGTGDTPTKTPRGESVLTRPTSVQLWDSLDGAGGRLVSGSTPIRGGCAKV